jgi:hypothetical protein
MLSFYLFSIINRKRKTSIMRTQRNLRRLDFDLIESEMPVIYGDLLRSIIGGYKDDCFWRCVAHLYSGSSSISESEAASYADDYFYTNYPENGHYYSGSVAVTNEQMREYLSYISDSSSSTFNLIQFDPKLAPNAVLAGELTHVVVFLEDLERDGKKFMLVLDPQQGSSYEIPIESVLDILGSGGSSIRDNVGSSSDYGGSSDYGSSSYYG